MSGLYCSPATVFFALSRTEISEIVSKKMGMETEMSGSKRPLHKMEICSGKLASNAFFATPTAVT